MIRERENRLTIVVDSRTLPAAKVGSIRTSRFKTDRALRTK